MPNLGVASFGTRLMSTKMRRRYVKEGLDQASAMADVVVLDGGPLLETSFTLDLARLSDSVIVAVPPQERVKVLSLVSDETAGRQILPVWTRTHRSFLERFGDFLSGRSRRARIKAKSMSRAVVRKEPRPRPPAVRQPAADAGDRQPLPRRSAPRARRPPSCRSSRAAPAAHRANSEPERSSRLRSRTCLSSGFARHGTAAFDLTRCGRTR